MQCHLCRGPLTHLEANGASARGCESCRHFWVRSGIPAEELEGRWLRASNAGDALCCPSCEAPRLALGSVGNRSLHRCDACGGYFVSFSPRSAREAAEVLAQIGADALAALLG